MRFAAVAGGVKQETLSTWRTQGESDREALDDGIEEKIADLRELVASEDHETALSWEEIEEEVDQHLTSCLRLSWSMDEIDTSWASQRLDGIRRAGTGDRTEMRATKDGLVEVPSKREWQADAWLLEHTTKDFRRADRIPPNPALSPADLAQHLADSLAAIEDAYDRPPPGSPPTRDTAEGEADLGASSTLPPEPESGDLF